MADLYVALTEGDIALEPLCEAHREGLRAACQDDPDIWDIYPLSYWGDAFDPQFDIMLNSGSARQCYAVLKDGIVVGMTAWIASGARGHAIEIGNTYIVPCLRGTGFNSRLKRLMIDHAVSLGIMRIVLKVDEINTRSQAAVLKLGCTREGVLRAERITWTGRVRNTVMYSILADEWCQQQSR